MTTSRSVSRLILAEVFDQRQQPASEIAGFLALDLLACALQRLAEALAIERLEDVVERADLEGLERVLIVGGHEDDEWHPLAADGLDHVEAVHLRHLHVEEDQIGRVVLNRGDGLFAVAALADHLDVLFAASSVASRSRASGSSSTMSVLIFFMIIPSVRGGPAPGRLRCRDAC